MRAATVITTAALAATLTTGCAHRPTPTPTPDPWHDPALTAALQDSETAPAVGMLAPARGFIGWLGQLLLQAAANTTLQIKVDATTPTPATPKAP